MKFYPSSDFDNYKVVIGSNEEFESLISNLLTIINPNDFCYVSFSFKNNNVTFYGMVLQTELFDIIRKIVQICQPVNITDKDCLIKIYDQPFSPRYLTSRERITGRSDITQKLLNIGITQEDINKVFAVKTLIYITISG